MSSFDLKYGSYNFNGLPIPDISLDTSFDTTSAGRIIGSTVKIAIRGLIYATGDLNDRSNYNGSGPGAFQNLLSYMSGLKQAFSQDYQELKLTCNNIPILPDNIKSNTTKVNSISFSRNGSDPNMLSTVEYNIDLSVETTGSLTYISDLNNSEFYVSSIENSYTIESLDTLNYYGHSAKTESMYPELYGTHLPMYRITRTLGANGKAVSGVGALINAKKFVSGLIEKDVAFTNIINNLTVFERSTSVETSEIDGKYSITDNFTAISGSPLNPWTETFTINHSMDDSFKRTITINGTIQGLGSGWSTSWDIFKKVENKAIAPYRPPTLSKYDCASSGYNRIKNKIFSRVACVAFPVGNNSSNFPSYTGIINPIPVSISVNHDFNNGSITYDYSYDTRPLSLVPGSLSENLSVEDSYATRSYATIPVLFKQPIFQDLGTYSLPSRTVTYDAVFPSVIKLRGSGIEQITENQIKNVLYSFDPSSLFASQIVGIFSQLIKDDINIDVMSGKYNRSVTWNYQKKSR